MFSDLFINSNDLLANAIYSAIGLSELQNFSFAT